MKKTMIIAVHNPEDAIVSYVEELLSACVPQVIVVDDGSDMLYQPAFTRLEQLPGCTVIHHDGAAKADKAVKAGIEYYNNYLKPLSESQLLAVNYDSVKDREYMLAYVQDYAIHPFHLTLRDLIPEQIVDAIKTPITEGITLARVFITGGLRAISRY